MCWFVNGINSLHLSVGADVFVCLRQRGKRRIITIIDKVYRVSIIFVEWTLVYAAGFDGSACTALPMLKCHEASSWASFMVGDFAMTFPSADESSLFQYFSCRRASAATAAYRCWYDRAAPLILASFEQYAD